jgi:hypothetical protein
MSRPSLVRWAARWYWGSAIGLTLVALGLFVVNVVDYLPYRLALRRVERLDPEALRAIGDACIREEQLGHREVSGDEIPREFRSLKPLRISFDPRSTEVQLQETIYSNPFGRYRGYDLTLYVFLKISTTSENQIITCVSNGRGKQTMRTLWERHPDVSRRVDPKDRIVTVTQMEMHSQREWIVRPAELLVVDRPYTVGSGPAIAARIPLEPKQRTEIESAIASIDSQTRGHLFDSGALDGILLRISFAADGSHRNDDVELDNVWRDEAAPLTNAISAAAGPAYVIRFPEIVQEMNADQHFTPIIMTWEEHERREFSVFPWWCFWPRLGIARQ